MDIRFHISKHVPAYTLVPVRVHKRTRSQSQAYHERIQKKWIKRYGIKKQAFWVRRGDCFAVHPDTYAQLKQHVEVEHGLSR